MASLPRLAIGRVPSPRPPWLFPAPKSKRNRYHCSCTTSCSGLKVPEPRFPHCPACKISPCLTPISIELAFGRYRPGQIRYTCSAGACCCCESVTFREQICTLVRHSRCGLTGSAERIIASPRLVARSTCLVVSNVYRWLVCVILEVELSSWLTWY
jgi:hypothetical protein